MRPRRAAGDLGLVASLGAATAGLASPRAWPSFPRQRAASVGETLDEGCVYASNRYTLWGMLQRLGVEVLTWASCR